eukprot:scaffold633_cov288-Ochromonas_danica.AAC.68
MQQSQESVRYRTTRGLEKNVSFEEVVLGGLGKDRGLFVPETVPKLSKKEIENVGFTHLPRFYHRFDLPLLSPPFAGN